MGRFIRALGLIAFVGVFLPGCSSGGGGGGGSTSLSGTILDPSGTGLPGVGILVESPTALALPAEAVTDADGNFIVLRPPTGLVDVHIDGPVGGTFASLKIRIVVGGGASNLPRSIVLPDLADGATMDVPLDASNQTMGVMTIIAPDGSTLDIPDMTTITVPNQVAGAPVTVNITPVPPINVPMPLPGSLDAGAFVSIQPPDATFSPGLGLTLPNSRGYPVGTMVDIWSFDHDLAAWVNRSQETGNQGVVDPTGTLIVATGVITKGGWHSGVLPVVASCATIVSGQVLAEGVVPSTPVPGVLISLSTGQFTSTDASGMFSIASVPAYNAADASMTPPVCTGAEITLKALAPVSFGAGSIEPLLIPAGTIVVGGTTTLAPFDIPVTNKGSLVGSVTDSGNGVQGTVSITGAKTLEVATDENGSFFVAALDPGAYMATFPFTSGDVSKSFTIVANKTTILSLTAGPPVTGGGPLSVKVIDFTSVQAGTVVADACVTLKGASGASQFDITDANGVADFPNAPSGPYTVTAQKDTVVPGPVTNRLATSLVGVNPTATPRTIVVPFLDSNFLTTPVVDATLAGTILNPPAAATFFIFEVSNDSVGFQTSSPASGGFNALVPSGVPLDVAVTAFDTNNVILSAVIETNVMVPSGQTLMRDFDFSTAAPFDQTVNLTFTNTPAHDGFSLELRLSAAGELSFPLLNLNGTAALPTSIDLPNLANSTFTPFEARFGARTEKFPPFAESTCDKPLDHSTPGALALAFLGIPTIQDPADGVNFATYGSANSVKYTLGSGNGTSTGVNSITFVGGTKTGTNDVFIFWDILVPAATTMVPIPPVAVNKPMFAPGFYFVNVGTVRFAFPGFDFATFFDQNFPSNLAAVDMLGDCEGDVSHSFTVGQAPIVTDRGAGAGHERQVKQAKLFGAR